MVNKGDEGPTDEPTRALTSVTMPAMGAVIVA